MPISRGKAGDGFGRPLFQLNTVELPKSPEGRRCISARMDKHTHALTVDENEHDGNSIAWACLNDRLDETGFANLEVSTTDDLDVPLVVRAYTAGFLEGLLTAPRMGQFYRNVIALLKKDVGNDAGMEAVDRVVRMSLVAWENFGGGDAQSEPQDDLPKQGWATLLQMRGLRDGNNYVALRQDSEVGSEMNPQQLSAYDIMMINMHKELPLIVELYSRSEQARALTPNAIPRSSDEPYTVWSSHQPGGSAIVTRVGPQGAPEDVLAGHVSLGTYSEMVRIMKFYKLNFNTMVSGVTMSSYPGCVSSTDDYFVTERGFVAMSTNLHIPMEGEYSVPAASNDGLPSFLRAVMATRLATQPRSWAKAYGYLAGIAGAKQWLVVDYGKFKENQRLANDTVWLVESLPRLQRANDVTHVLERSGFVEVHAVPHFADIRKAYGLPEDGPGSYQEHVQSALVDKGATISNLATARQMLTEVSPSRRGIQSTITARNDLTGQPPIPTGGVGHQVTNRCLVRKMGLEAKSGPPLTNAGQPFQWIRDDGTETFPGWPREGVPDELNFTWIAALPGLALRPIEPSDEDCLPIATSGLAPSI